MLLYAPLGSSYTRLTDKFQWAPTLGGECYRRCSVRQIRINHRSWFQWAPTLGGECYNYETLPDLEVVDQGFNGHPPLGVNATQRRFFALGVSEDDSFNGHPPLGVNATLEKLLEYELAGYDPFQWAPTLGGECYLWTG